MFALVLFALGFGIIVGFIICADLTVESLKAKGLWETYLRTERVSVKAETKR